MFSARKYSVTSTDSELSLAMKNKIVFAALVKSYSEFHSMKCDSGLHIPVYRLSGTL